MHVQLGRTTIDTNGSPVYVIGEIGINHNGSLKVAKELIDVAVDAGCDAVKFQKRTPEICVPKEQRDKRRDTPWGEMSYMQYRERVEFGEKEYAEIDAYCKKKGIAWFASCWDAPSIAFMEMFSPACHKIPSAMITDYMLLKAFGGTERPLIMSTGMSTRGQIRRAVKQLGQGDLIVMHCNSEYPCPVHHLNLRGIQTLQTVFPTCPIGYSGHELGFQPTLTAVALGAVVVERHITLAKNMWGSDQACSLEPAELTEMVQGIRSVEKSLGTGSIVVTPAEKEIREKLRRI